MHAAVIEMVKQSGLHVQLHEFHYISICALVIMTELRVNPRPAAYNACVCVHALRCHLPASRSQSASTVSALSSRPPNNCMHPSGFRLDARGWPVHYKACIHGVCNNYTKSSTRLIQFVIVTIRLSLKCLLL